MYESHDYKRLGEVANYVLLMTYEWGYTYGPPMAVAPVNKVREVLDYAITEIPAEKIFMGIPNYGYDWTLPFIKGTSKAKSVGNVEAVELARSVGAMIEFDEVAMAPYFYYNDTMGNEHVVANGVDNPLRMFEGLSEKIFYGNTDFDVYCDVINSTRFSKRAFEDLNYCPCCEETNLSKLQAMHLDFSREINNTTNSIVLCKDHAWLYYNNYFRFSKSGRVVIKREHPLLDARMHLNLTTSMVKREFL